MSGSGYDLDEMETIIKEFMVEAKEIVGGLDSNLVKLEKDPGNLNLLNEIFRGAHTLKGAAGFLGFNELMRLTHKMEDVLNKLRKGELAVTPDGMDILLESIDVLKLTLNDIIDRQQGRTDTAGIIARLESMLNPAVKETPPTGSAAETAPANESQAAESKPPASASGPPQSSAKTSETAGHGEKSAPNKPTATVAATTRQKDYSIKGESTIRVDVKRLDNLVNMVGELVLGRNALIQQLGVFQAKMEGQPEIEQLSQVATQLNFITTELHTAIMKIRMLPVGNVFSKFPRMVRDLSRDLGKQIDLLITGEETELDKSVLEELSDPLIHLIRNSIDHGIETPEERTRKGKSAKGIIKLSAYQEGNNIVIEVIDDGRGMDIEAIKKKAIERNLVSQEEAAKLSEKELLSFIFLPGFSTAKKTTDISGRGVGMDVVRTNIEKLKGTIDLATKLGEGSKVTIRLPLTLAIVQGLLVSCGKEIFAIPLSSVLETVVVTADQIKYVNRRPVVRLRDTILPIVDLMELLFNNPPRERHQINVVVVGLAERKLGVVVDSLLGQEEVVIKAIGEYLGHVRGIAGATIMGDGRVRLIIDLAGLFDLALKK